MNEREEIMTQTEDAIHDLVKQFNDQHEVTPTVITKALTVLVGGMLCDLRRIAAAIEKLAKANPDPTQPLTLRDLTVKEREIVKALRSGRIDVLYSSSKPDE